MRSACATATTAVAALALAVLPVTSAYAAKGYFYYADTANVSKHIKDPHDGHCYKRPGKGHVENKTDKVVYLYSNAQCDGTPEESMSPGDIESNVQFEAFKFIA